LKHISTVAFSVVFGSGEGIIFVSAGLETDFCGEGVEVKLVLSVGYGAEAYTFGITSFGHVLGCNGCEIHDGIGGIEVD